MKYSLTYLEFFFLHRDLTDMMSNVAEQVNKNVNQYMLEHGFHARDMEKQASLLGQVKSLSSRDHPVYKLMCKNSFFLFGNNCFLQSLKNYTCYITVKVFFL